MSPLLTQSGHPELPEPLQGNGLRRYDGSSKPRGEAMRRRDFIEIVAGSAAAWPVTARAQQQALPVIGYLSSGSPGPYQHLVAAFHRGLKETGYVEGQNVAIEYRWTDGQNERLPAL